MRTTSRAATTRSRIALAGLIGILAVAGAPSAMAAIPLDALSQDSDLVLIERNDFGAYQRYDIRLSIRQGEVSLSLDRDGASAKVSVPLDEALALWERLMASDVETVGDSPSEGGIPPDQSHFTVSFRTAGAERVFRAYGVDSIADTRYHKIVNEILSLADRYLDAAQASAPNEEE